MLLSKKGSKRDLSSPPSSQGPRLKGLWPRKQMGVYGTWHLFKNRRPARMTKGQPVTLARKGIVFTGADVCRRKITAALGVCQEASAPGMFGGRQKWLRQKKIVLPILLRTSSA